MAKDREIIHPKDFVKDVLGGRIDFKNAAILEGQLGNVSGQKTYTLSGEEVVGLNECLRRRQEECPSEYALVLDDVFTRFNASGLHFNRISAYRATFHGILTSVSFEGAKVDLANFDYCDLTDGNFFGDKTLATMQYVNFYGAKLRRANFRESISCNFGYADLRESCIHRAVSCNFDNADLRGVEFRKQYGSPLISCYLENTKVTKDLEDALKNEVHRRQLDIYEIVPGGDNTE